MLEARKKERGETLPFDRKSLPWVPDCSMIKRVLFGEKILRNRGCAGVSGVQHGKDFCEDTAAFPAVWPDVWFNPRGGPDRLRVRDELYYRRKCPVLSVNYWPGPVSGLWNTGGPAGRPGDRQAGNRRSGRSVGGFGRSGCGGPA